MVIIRVKDLNDGLRQILLLNSFLVSPLSDSLKLKVFTGCASQILKEFTTFAVSMIGISYGTAITDW